MQELPVRTLPHGRRIYQRLLDSKASHSATSPTNDGT
jgi:hypothetical protein